MCGSMFRSKGRWITVELSELTKVLNNIRKYGGFKDREFGLNIEHLSIDVSCNDPFDDGFRYQIFVPEHVFRNMSVDIVESKLFE